MSKVKNERVVRILKKARKVIAERENWCQGTIDNMKGAYCAIGAVNKATGIKSMWNIPECDRHGSAREKAAFFLANAINGQTNNEASAIYTFNDSYRHADVLAAFDRAIELASKNKATKDPVELVRDL